MASVSTALCVCLGVWRNGLRLRARCIPISEFRNEVIKYEMRRKERSMATGRKRCGKGSRLDEMSNRINLRQNFGVWMCGHNNHWQLTGEQLKCVVPFLRSQRNRICAALVALVFLTSCVYVFLILYIYEDGDDGGGSIQSLIHLSITSQ